MYEFQVDSCGLEEMNFEQLIAVFDKKKDGI